MSDRSRDTRSEAPDEGPHQVPDPGLEWPDGPPPEDPAEGAPGSFVDPGEGPQHPDPGLEWPDGPPPPDPSKGADRAP